MVINLYRKVVKMYCFNLWVIFYSCMRQRPALFMSVTRARYSVAVRCIATCTTNDVKSFFRLKFNEEPLQIHGY